LYSRGPDFSPSFTKGTLYKKLTCPIWHVKMKKINLLTKISPDSLVVFEYRNVGTNCPNLPSQLTKKENQHLKTFRGTEVLVPTVHCTAKDIRKPTLLIYWFVS